jgi:predicted ester cyclase
MAVQRNKALVRRFFEAVNSGDFSIFDDLVDAAYGKDEQMFYRGLRQIFPDLVITIEDLIAEGDTVMLRFTARGTQEAEFRGIPASGEQMSWGGLQLFNFVDGKIVEHLIAAESLSLMPPRSTMATLR